MDKNNVAKDTTPHWKLHITQSQPQMGIVFLKGLGAAVREPWYVLMSHSTLSFQMPAAGKVFKGVRIW